MNDRNQGPSEPLRLLLIDDNADDRLLVARQLRRELAEPEVRQVTGPADFEQALARGGFDVVITDYQLHWTTGLDVLRRIKLALPLMPVIMFTATGTQEMAVEAMKAGLDDYVIKSPKHYVRLAASVRAVLDRAEERRARSEAEQRYQQLFTRLPIGLWACDAEGRLTEANPMLLELLGLPDHEAALGLRLSALFRSERDRARWQRALELEDPVRGFEARLARPDGRRLSVRLDASTRRNADEEPIAGYEGSLADITDRVRAERALRRSRRRLRETNKQLEQRVAERTAEAEQRAQQLRVLARQLSTAEQRERQRIAHTLHEHFQQILVGAKMALEGNSAGGDAAAEQAKSLIDQAIQASRTLAVELHPPVLYDQGLAAALQWLVRHYKDLYGLNVLVEADERAVPISPVMRSLLFESVRELLVNVVKHAGTKTAWVRLREAEGRVQVEVEDRGVGCDMDEALRSRAEREAFGLFSIQQRVELLGGRFEMVSEEGCRVTLSVPMSGLAGSERPAGQ